MTRSSSGQVTGPWRQEGQAVWSADGGHGMVARLGDGTLASD
ncbi:MULTISPECIES: hypothetical protein [unclassified Nonomuraea]